MSTTSVYFITSIPCCVTRKYRVPISSEPCMKYSSDIPIPNAPHAPGYEEDSKLLIPWRHPHASPHLLTNKPVDRYRFMRGSVGRGFFILLHRPTQTNSLILAYRPTLRFPKISPRPPPHLVPLIVISITRIQQDPMCHQAHTSP